MKATASPLNQYYFKRNPDFPGINNNPAREEPDSHSTPDPDIEPEDFTLVLEAGEDESTRSGDDEYRSGDSSGNGLDVPGSESDDEDEKIGSEDEENNYYSLGGDDHNGLEEEQGT